MDTKEIRKVFNFLETNNKNLTTSQTEFVKSLKKYFRWKGNLSPKQAECLISIKANIPVTVEQD